MLYPFALVALAPVVNLNKSMVMLFGIILFYKKRETAKSYFMTLAKSNAHDLVF